MRRAGSEPTAGGRTAQSLQAAYLNQGQDDGQSRRSWGKLTQRSVRVPHTSPCLFPSSSALLKHSAIGRRRCRVCCREIMACLFSLNGSISSSRHSHRFTSTTRPLQTMTIEIQPPAIAIGKDFSLSSLARPPLFIYILLARAICS